MRRIALLLSIITASLVCTACINNFAIKELNQTGKQYLDKGEYEEAIARFKSSIDLDETIFESHYNLAVALLSNNKFDEAIKAAEDAIKINPEFADAYYTLALAHENKGLESITQKDAEGEEEISKEAVQAGLIEASSSIQYYNKYLAMENGSKDKEWTKNHIRSLANEITRIAEDNNIDITAIIPDIEQESKEEDANSDSTRE